MQAGKKALTIAGPIIANTANLRKRRSLTTLKFLFTVSTYEIQEFMVQLFASVRVVTSSDGLHIATPGFPHWVSHPAQNNMSLLTVECDML